jgi:hypothetical protein
MCAMGKRKKKTPRGEGNLLMFTPIAPLTSMEGHEWLYLIFLTTSYQEQIILNDKLIVPLVPYDCYLKFSSLNSLAATESCKGILGLDQISNLNIRVTSHIKEHHIIFCKMQQNSHLLYQIDDSR